MGVRKFQDFEVLGMCRLELGRGLEVGFCWVYGFAV